MYFFLKIAATYQAVYPMQLDSKESKRARRKQRENGRSLFGPPGATAVFSTIFVRRSLTQYNIYTDYAGAKVHWLVIYSFFSFQFKQQQH